MKTIRMHQRDNEAEKNTKCAEYLSLHGLEWGEVQLF